MLLLSSTNRSLGMPSFSVRGATHQIKSNGTRGHQLYPPEAYQLQVGHERCANNRPSPFACYLLLTSLFLVTHFTCIAHHALPPIQHVPAYPAAAFSRVASYSIADYCYTFTTSCVNAAVKSLIPTFSTFLLYVPYNTVQALAPLPLHLPAACHRGPLPP